MPKIDVEIPEEQVWKLTNPYQVYLFFDSIGVSKAKLTLVENGEPVTYEYLHLGIGEYQFFREGDCPTNYLVGGDDETQ